MKDLLGGTECPFEAVDEELFKVSQTARLCFSPHIEELRGRLGRLSSGRQGSRLINKTEGGTTGSIARAT